MPTATLTSKGQITIPVDVRNNLKVDAGARVEFVQIAPGRYEFVAATHNVQERMAASAGCEQTMTFDASAARHAGMTLIR